MGMTYNAMPAATIPSPPRINHGGIPLDSMVVVGEVAVGVDAVVGEGAMVAVVVAVVWRVGQGVAVAVRVAVGRCVAVAVAVKVAVGAGVFVGRSVAVAVTILVAVATSAAGAVTLVAVPCAAFAEGLLGASILAAPIEPSTIKRGAPPIRQPPVHVAPAISISYLPSRAVIVCLWPFQSTNAA